MHTESDDKFFIPARSFEPKSNGDIKFNDSLLKSSRKKICSGKQPVIDKPKIFCENSVI